MSTAHRLIFTLSVLSEVVYGQRFVGDVCTLQSTGVSGECKRFTDCQVARDYLQEYNKHPQKCAGLAGKEPLFCCPKTENPAPLRKPGEISKGKCEENARFVFGKRVEPVLLINPPEVTRNECGHEVVKLIVGGEPAGTKEFPHMAAIGYGTDHIKWLCGGTILSEEYVLTAAHCLRYHSREAKWVKLGVTDLKDTSIKVQDIKIVDRIYYPLYNSNVHYHDIGLIQLEQPAKLNPYARPACLYLEPKVTVQTAMATGWGSTTYPGNLSNKLQKVTLDLFDNVKCNVSYEKWLNRKFINGIVRDIQLCAGSDTEDKDTCVGDSGGPLQIYHTGDNITCMYDIIGVTSFGKAACSGKQSVYVRVSYYVKWIEDVVWS